MPMEFLDYLHCELRVLGGDVMHTRCICKCRTNSACFRGGFTLLLGHKPSKERLHPAAPPPPSQR